MSFATKPQTFKSESDIPRFWKIINLLLIICAVFMVATLLDAAQRDFDKSETYRPSMKELTHSNTPSFLVWIHRQMTIPPKKRTLWDNFHKKTKKQAQSTLLSKNQLVLLKAFGSS